MMDFPWVMLDYRRVNSTRISSFPTKKNNGYVFLCPVFPGKAGEIKKSTSPLLDFQLQCQILRAVQAFLEAVEVAKAVEESVACQLANKGFGWDPPSRHLMILGVTGILGGGSTPTFKLYLV